MHFAVDPAGSEPLAAAVGADEFAAVLAAGVMDLAAEVAAGDDGDAEAAGGEVAGDADAPPGEAGVMGAAGTAALAELDGFCTPPCPLHAPLPEAEDVEPSLQVVEPAAGADEPPGEAGVRGAAGVAELEGEAGVFCTPPWPLQAPLPVVAEVVPSLQVEPPELGTGVPPGEAGVSGAAGTAEVVAVDEAAFCTPPWPLHAPLPVAVEVVPSLHIVGVESA